MERLIWTICISLRRDVQSCQGKVYSQGRPKQVVIKRSRRLCQHRLGCYIDRLISISLLILRMTWISAQILSTTESYLFGGTRQILAPWWIISKKWIFFMYKTLRLSFSTGRKHHKRVKRSSMVTKVFWTFSK